EFELKIDNITLKNGRFRFYDESMDYQTERGMDYGDMDYFGINAILKDFDLINDSLMIDIIMLQTQEKSGLKVENVSTKFSISSTLMEVNNTILNTEKSSLDFDLDFNYKSYSDMSEFLDSVLMKTTIKSSEINMAELGYFSDIMFEMPNVIKVTGSGIGTVRELSGNNLVIEYGDNTKVTGGFYIRGLPDFFTSYIQLGIQDFNTTICDIQSFNLPIEGNYLNLPFNIKCNEVINLSGNFKGYYTDFESNIQLFYDESSINSNIVFNEGKNDSISLVGSVNANGFHIGKLLEMQDLMGRASFNSKLEIKGIYPDKLTYDYELIISDIFLLNNDLKRLRFKGNIKDNIVKSNYRVADKKMLAFGDFNFNINKYSLDLNSNIKRADIYKLGFWGEPLLLSSGLSLSLEGKDINEMDLELELVDLSMKFKQDEYLLSLLNFTKDRNSDNNNLLKLESTIADATLSGQFNITTVANSTLSLIDSYYKFFDPAMPNPEDENVSFSINFKKPKFFNKHLFNGIEIENGSTINADIDFVNKLIDAQIYSEAMSVFGVDMVSNSLIVTSNSDFLNLNYSADRVVFKDSSDYDKTVLGLDSLNIDTRMMNNYLGYSFQWNNSNSKLENRGLLKGSMVHDSVFDNFSIDYSDVVINNSNWKVDTNNIIGFIPGGIKIENLNIYADNSKLEVEGEYFG
ncbi:MAG: hypothetical protein C0598_08875, partial [Marinilabiliales bacterium]